VVDDTTHVEKHKKHAFHSTFAHPSLLHHDNAPARTAFILNDYLAKSRVPLVPQPPYSPDVALADFLLFPRIKSQLKGKHLGTVNTIQEATTRALKDLPVDVFQGAFLA